MADETPFFIVGSGRCGSTLLRLMLCAHSRIHIPPETWFITDLVRELPLTAPLVPAQVERAVAIMTTNYRWPDMGIPAEDLRRCVRDLDHPMLVDIITLVYHHHLRLHGKQKFGDKTPQYIDIIPQLSILFPGAKFIHLIRDGRDVAISYLDMREARYYQRNFLWTNAMRRRRIYQNSRHADQILEVKYEDLVITPEPTLRKVCAFLGNEFEAEMLAWQHLTELVPERERAIHTKLTDPLRPDAVAVWRRRVSGLECFAMESCLQSYLREIGYQLRFSGIAWRPFLIASGWCLRALAPLLSRAIPYLQRRNCWPRALSV